MNIKIAPSILSADFSRLGAEIKAVEAAGADAVHIDVMDGRFVPNLTIGPFIVSAVRKVTSLPLDVHLMIENPDQLIPEFIKAGANFVTVHVEACPHLHRTIQLIKQLGAAAGVALNPATPVSSVEDIFDEIDLLLIMSVNPGFGGQRFIQRTFAKIEQARVILTERGLKTCLSVDGGVSRDNAGALQKAGVNLLVAGSAIFNATDYHEAMMVLKGTAPH